MKNKEKIMIYIWLISIICAIVIGAIFLLQRPSAAIINSNKNMLLMVEKIRSFYGNRPDYWGLNSSEVIKQNLYVGTINNNQILNNLNKPVTIGSDETGNMVMPGQHSFSISYKELNKEECTQLASFSWSEQEKLGLISLSIFNENKDYEFSWGVKGLPLSRSKAKEYCKEKNSIMWTFE